MLHLLGLHGLLGVGRLVYNIAIVSLELSHWVERVKGLGSGSGVGSFLYYGGW
jgi:hypothetical protein